MALLEDLLKSETSRGVAIGIASAVLTPLILPALAGAGRPLARAAIKGGIILYDKTRETAAEMAEVFEDLVAEARAEIDQGGAYAKPDDAAETGTETAAKAGKKLSGE